MERLCSSVGRQLFPGVNPENNGVDTRKPLQRRRKMLNLTQHNPTPAQKKAGVVEPNDKEQVRALLTFRDMPTPEDLEARADALASLAAEQGAKEAMIGGAPYLMEPLSKALRARGIQPCFAFSQRKAVEKVQPDGTVVKTQVFEHLGFIPA